MKIRNMLVIAACILLVPIFTACGGDKDRKTAQSVLKDYFEAYETADYVRMADCCTVEFQEQFFHDNDVFGYTTAKLLSISNRKIDTGDQNILAYEVQISAVPVEGSANYNPDEPICKTNVMCILEKQPDGQWLISDLSLDL